jgi:hypothetical protein
VEAWAFEAVGDGSVYKFYLPREEKRIGSEFGFQRGDETLLLAEARLGDYRGPAGEAADHPAPWAAWRPRSVAVTPEGILVAKQALGETLPQGDDMSGTCRRA